MADSPRPLQSLLSSIVQSSDDAIVSKDLHSTVTSWNPAAERMFGYTSSEMIGQSIRAIIPEDRQHEEDEVLARIRAGESVDHFETVRRRKDGTLVDISLSISPIRDDSGTIIGASKIARDISERLRAQAEQERNRQQAIFLSRLSATFATSFEPKQILMSLANLSVPYFADWCAVDLRQPNGPIERLALVHVEPAKMQLVSRLRERYENAKSPTSPTAVIRTGMAAIALNITDAMLVDVAKDDEERLRLLRSLNLVSYLCLPLKVHGRTIGAVTMAMAESGRHFDDDDVRIAEDAASRAALAVDNARAYEQLQVANQLKDEFLATLSHELRTPLNAILGYTRLLQSGMIGDDRRASALTTVERNAFALTQIVEDILDVSRIISGKIRLNIQPVDVADVVKNAVDTIRPAADAKQIRIQMILDPRAAISGDPDRLQQVVWNLVSNAVKFTPKQGIVQVLLERINSHVEIVVSDTGAGIAPDFLPHIFERFRQADSGTTREHGGIGLGLAIVRHLVELHGGTIHASSGGKDQGSTFRVRLPVMIVQTETVSERRAHGEPTRPLQAALPRLDGLRVLAVDDDADARALIGETLEPAGAKVTTADSVVRALELLPSVRPDVLIADIGMVGTDGFELIRRIRAARDDEMRTVPAVALTAYARAEDRVKALQAGFQMHLAKPVDPAELIVAVAALAKQSPHRSS